MAKTRTEIDVSTGSVRVDRPDRHVSPQSDYLGLGATAHGDPPGHDASSQALPSQAQETKLTTSQANTCHATATPHVMSTLVRATRLDITRHHRATVHPTIIQSSPARLTRTGHYTVSPDQCDVSSFVTPRQRHGDKLSQILSCLDIATPQAKSRHNPATPQNGSLRGTPVRHLHVIATCHVKSCHLAPQRLANPAFVKSPLGDRAVHYRTGQPTATVQDSSDNSRSVRRAYPSSAHVYATLQTPNWSEPSDNVTSRHVLSSPGDVSHRLRSTRHTSRRQAASAHFMSSRRDYPILNVSVPGDVTLPVGTARFPATFPTILRLSPTLRRHISRPHLSSQTPVTVHVRPETVHSDGPVQNGSLLFRATSRDKTRSWQALSQRPSRPGRHAPPLHVSERRVTSSPYCSYPCDCGHSIPHQDTSDHGDYPTRFCSTHGDYPRRSASRLFFATDRYGPRSWQPFATSHAFPPHLVTVPCDESWLLTSRSLLATSHSGATFVPTEVCGLKCDKPSQAFSAPVLVTTQPRTFHPFPIRGDEPLRSTTDPSDKPGPVNTDPSDVPCPDRPCHVSATSLANSASRPSDMPSLVVSGQCHVSATGLAKPCHFVATTQDVAIPVLATIPSRSPLHVATTHAPPRHPDATTRGVLCLHASSRPVLSSHVRSAHGDASVCVHSAQAPATAPAKPRPAPATGRAVLRPAVPTRGDWSSQHRSSRHVATLRKEH